MFHIDLREGSFQSHGTPHFRNEVVLLFCFGKHGLTYSGYILKGGLEFLILLPPVPRYWDCGCMTPQNNQNRILYTDVK